MLKELDRHEVLRKKEMIKIVKFLGQKTVKTTDRSGGGRMTHHGMEEMGYCVSRKR